ncbi:DUF1236 domain-containing protein [Aureimonas sp. AU22]|jgi:hypothetical protein|uniref:DUF1236 domain-containing protein n=1 Tax=Aureimonas sp. AU22 TaxID=1638162 RepID=UPI0009EA895F|nr:DUF1236 domain-containing protein [Aureimonas sp. AU22]
MRRLVALAGLATLIATPVLAQTTTTTIVTQEPAPAAVVAVPAPAPAAVVAVPAPVRTYVTQQSIPSVTYERQIVVGEPLPQAVEYHVIPDNDGYAYAVVNGQRVIVDPQTRSVIEVYD